MLLSQNLKIIRQKSSSRQLLRNLKVIIYGIFVSGHPVTFWVLFPNFPF